MSPASTLHAFDRHPVIVDPSELRPGDWLRDLGTLRKVETVDHSGPGASVRFVDGVPGEFETLSFPEAIPVTVWRTLPEQSAPSRAEA